MNKNCGVMILYSLYSIVKHFDQSIEKTLCQLSDSCDTFIIGVYKQDPCTFSR